MRRWRKQSEKKSLLLVYCGLRSDHDRERSHTIYKPILDQIALAHGLSIHIQNIA